MFNVGAGEMIVIALILLMAVGPEQLPGLIRRVGRTVSEVKGMTEGLRAEFMSGMEEIERATDPEAWAAGTGLSADAKPRATSEPAPGSVADQQKNAGNDAPSDSGPAAKGGTSEDGADLDDSVLDSTDQDDGAPNVEDWASKIGNGWDTPDASDEPVFPTAAEAALSSEELEESDGAGSRADGKDGTEAGEAAAAPAEIDGSGAAATDGPGSEEQP